MRYLALCGMLAALTTAAWRYGWQSTAIIGAAANLSVVAMMPKLDDLATIQAQGVLAVGLSGLLLLGARLNSEQLQATQRESTSRRMARRDLFAVERHRLAYACVLDEVFCRAHQQATRMMQTARAVLPASVIAEHHRQFTDLHQQHQRLTAGLSPRAWWQFGGPDGPIAQTLEQLGVTCEIREPSSAAGLCTLSTELSIALYRLSCEAVAYLMQHAPSRHVSMEMTARAAAGQSIVVDVIVQSTGEALPPLADAYHPFLLSLGASGLSEQALAHRLQLYDGHLQVVQTSPQHMHMLLRVSEPAASFGMACP
jgi:hypothetical protein